MTVNKIRKTLKEGLEDCREIPELEAIQNSLLVVNLLESLIQKVVKEELSKFIDDFQREYEDCMDCKESKKSNFNGLQERRSPKSNFIKIK